MLQLSPQSFWLLLQQPGFITKTIAVIVLVVYSFFLLVLNRQVTSLNRIVTQTTFGAVVKFIAVLLVVWAVVIIVGVLVLPI